MTDTVGRDARFFVRSTADLREALEPWLGGEPPGDRLESVYFDDPLLVLPPEARVRARSLLDARGRASGYRLDLPGASDTARGLSLEGAGVLARRRLGLADLGPCFAVRFRRQRLELRGVGHLTLDTEVEYVSLLGPSEVVIGREPHPRVRLELGRRPRRLHDALVALPRLPPMSKRWMGYFYTKKHIKPPSVNELAGHEYEIRLATDTLEVDLDCLPFPILCAYQTESIRRYYEGYRVGFRLARATRVEKGPVELLGGVERRAEQKEKELSAWDLPAPLHEMRRFKKTYLLHNPETRRTYNLGLDLCVAAERMRQIEIEYDGTLGRPGPEPRADVEQAVLRDLRRIRDALVERHGLTTTRATKRDWLRKKARDAA